MSDNADFVNSVHLAEAKIIERLYNNTQKACLKIEGSAKQKVNSDMGELAASINSETKLDGKSITGTIGTNLKYAPYVHQGTGIYAKDGSGRKTPWSWCADSGKYEGWHSKFVGQRPNPFLEEARDENLDTIVQILAE